MSSRPARPSGGSGGRAGSSGPGPGATNGRVQGAGRAPSRAAGSLAGTRNQDRLRAAASAATSGDVMVNARLRTLAAYAWRFLVVGAAVYVAYMVLLRFELVGIALFLGLAFTSLLRPPVNMLSQHMPRPLALVLSMIGSIAVIGGVLTLVGTTVANETDRIGQEFSGGVSRIEKWLEGSPFHVNPSALTGLQGKISSFVSSHRSTLINQALSGASRAVEILTVLALAVFCAVFFTNSGGQMWRWFTAQLPRGSRTTWDRAGRAAWRTFSGYTRGTIIVAGSNAILVGIALYVLKVPLALPLMVLEFLLSFVPLIGSPVALAVATVVALAGRGVVTAAIVLVLIVVIGQIEGHVLQPLVMGWAVRLHPVAVAISVIAGTIVAGVMGAVVAVPFVSIAWAIVREMRLDPVEPADPLAPPGEAGAARASAAVAPVDRVDEPAPPADARPEVDAEVPADVPSDVP